MLDLQVTYTQIQVSRQEILLIITILSRTITIIRVIHLLLAKNQANLISSKIEGHQVELINLTYLEVKKVTK